MEQMTRFIAAVVLVLGLGAVPLYAAHAAGRPSAAIPVAHDLKAVGTLARQRQLPVLLEFAATTCGYCHTLESNVLNPMVRSGDYTHKVIMRKVVIDDDAPLRDFDGKTISATDLAKRYGVFVTPTVVLVDGRGMRLTREIVGVSSVDFYGYYLDQAIDGSLRHLRRAAAVKASVKAPARPSKPAGLSVSCAKPVHGDGSLPVAPQCRAG